MSKQEEHRRSLRRATWLPVVPIHLANAAMGVYMLTVDDPSSQTLGWVLYLLVTDAVLTLVRG